MYVNQSIQRPLGINVFGSRLIRVEPDYSSVRFSVTSTHLEPKDALAETHAAADRARQVLGRAHVSSRDVRASRVSLLQWHEGQGETRRAVGYRAHIGFQVFVRDLGSVEPLLLELVSAGAREIDSVTYKTSRLAEIRAEARAGAMAAARAKAEVYAKAAGQRVGKALHIEDINPDDFGRRSHLPDLDLSEDDPDSQSDIAGSIVVAAAVMACFALVD
jgi:uncharacterized protein YggE